MEIVKQLEGSKNEEKKEEHSQELGFEEYHLYKNEEERKQKKGIFVTIFSLATLSVLGFVGYKVLQSETNISTIDSDLIVTMDTNHTSMQKQDKNHTLPTITKVITTKSPSIIPIKEEEETKPVIYTEELALVHKEIETKVNVPKAVESISKPVTVSHEDEAMVKKINDINSSSLLAKEEISTLAKQIAKSVEAQSMVTPIVLTTKVVKAKVIKKKTIPKKKVIPKKIVLQKKTTKKTIPKTTKRRVITVKRGDTLAIISKRYYGKTNDFSRIIRANKRIKSHKTALRVGEKIIIPATGSSRKQKILSNKTRTIRVKRGDTLASLSKKYYGSSSKFSSIIKANKRIRSHKTALRIGEKIIIPAGRNSKKPIKRRIITVKKGYSLAYISKKFYGSTKHVQKIVRANKNIKNTNSTLRIGQKVYLPK